MFLFSIEPRKFQNAFIYIYIYIYIYIKYEETKYSAGVILIYDNVPM